MMLTRCHSGGNGSLFTYQIHYLLLGLEFTANRISSFYQSSLVYQHLHQMQAAGSALVLMASGCTCCVWLLLTTTDQRSAHSLPPAARIPLLPRGIFTTFNPSTESSARLRLLRVTCALTTWAGAVSELPFVLLAEE